MNRIIEHIIEKECVLRDFLRNRYTGRRIHFLREKGHILLNGRPVTVAERARKGDKLSLIFSEELTFDYPPQDMGLKEIYSDEDVLVVYKPCGVPSMPAAPHFDGNLFNGLRYLYPEGVFRVVTRLDKDTSGLLVCAKNDFSHRALSEELEHHGIVREYHALVNGGFKADTGTVNLPIGRHPVDRKRMAVLTDGTASAKHAITHYEVLESFGQISYLKLVLETGRTHQIRVHMSHGGHPLLGDTVYGGGRTLFERQHKSLLSGQALHAKRLILTHPRTGERMTFESALPEDFEKLLKILHEQN